MLFFSTRVSPSSGVKVHVFSKKKRAINKSRSKPLTSTTKSATS